MEKKDLTDITFTHGLTLGMNMESLEQTFLGINILNIILLDYEHKEVKFRSISEHFDIYWPRF